VRLKEGEKDLQILMKVAVINEKKSIFISLRDITHINLY
jgi:hypothetical protein